MHYFVLIFFLIFAVLYLSLIQHWINCLQFFKYNHQYRRRWVQNMGIKNCSSYPFANCFHCCYTLPFPIPLLSQNLLFSAISKIWKNVGTYFGCFVTKRLGDLAPKPLIGAHLIRSMTYLADPGNSRVDDTSTVGVFQGVFTEKEINEVTDVERTHELRIWNTH